jgi:PST family polysaccharide transporter/lipopolysaccharide exporter
MFPTYSKMQDDVEAMRSTYFRVLQLISVIAAPMAVGIAVVSPMFVETFLGVKWRPMVPAMQLLAIWGFALAIGSSSGSLFKAVGKPDYLTKVIIAKTAVLAVIIYPATQAYGITGTAAAIVVSALLTSEPIINYLVVREIRGRFTRFGWTVGVPLGASLLMGASIVLSTHTLPVRATVLHFLAVVVFGVLVYTLTMLLADRWLGYGTTTLLRSLAERLQ